MLTEDFGNIKVARRYWPLAAALVLGLTVTALLTDLLWRNAQRADQTRFDTLTHFMQERLDDRMEKYEQVMVLIREFFNQNNLPSQTAWRQLLDRLKLPVNYPGLMELGYAPCLNSAKLDSLRPALLQAIGTNFVLRPNLPPDEYYLPLVYLYVKSPNPASHFGFDLHYSGIEGQVNTAAFRNALTVTGRLPSDAMDTPFNVHGFCMLHTVYDTKLPVEIPRQPNESVHSSYIRLADQRIQNWQGTLAGVIDMDQFLSELVEGATLEIAFEIFDDPIVRPGRTIPQRMNEIVAIPSREDRIHRLDLTNHVSNWPMYSQRWSIVFYPTAEFEKRSPRRIAWIALGAGIATTLCLTGLVWVQLQRGLAAESHARQMNEARDVIASLSREREQTNRDLHDGVLQSLYALGLGLQKTRQTIRSNPIQADQMCQQHLDTLDLAMGEVRRHLDKNEPPALAELDLESALRNLGEIMSRQGRIPVRFESDSGCDWKPAPAMALQLLQIAREAISNAQRHSGASLIRISLSRKATGLTIADDGIGFDPEHVAAPGCGLRNMADRARDMGAIFQISSQSGAGTKITVSWHQDMVAAEAMRNN